MKEDLQNVVDCVCLERRQCSGGMMILLGDSDISRWPSSLYPGYPTSTSISSSTSSQHCNYAVGGAQMSDVLQQINNWKEDTRDITVDGNILICCAGENDLGSGRSIDQILETFRAVLDALFPSTKSHFKLIFIGPKFEPWLINDNTSRKQYTKLNNGLHRAIRKHHAKDQITYIDCLTLFCTEETANVPGAIHSKAIPDDRYFDKDGLHLNDMGYEKWKQIIEQKLTY